MRPSDTLTSVKPFWDPYVRTSAAAYKLPYSLVRGIIWIESTDNPGARSPVGALGLMQIMPIWAKRGEDLYDPETNILRGCFILAACFAKTKSWPQAISMYNGSLSWTGYIKNPVYVLQVFNAQQNYA